MYYYTDLEEISATQNWYIEILDFFPCKFQEKKKDISTACNGTIKCKTAHEKIPNEKNARFMYPGKFERERERKHINKYIAFIGTCIIEYLYFFYY